MAEPISPDQFLTQSMLMNLAQDEAVGESSHKAFKHDREAWRDSEEDDKNYESMPKPITIEWN